MTRCAGERKRAPVWRLDQALGGWTKVDPRSSGPGPARYCWPPQPTAATTRRPALTQLRTARSRDSPALRTAGGPGDGHRGRLRRRLGQRRPARWVSLQQHSDETRDQARALLAALRPDLPARAPTRS